MNDLEVADIKISFSVCFCRSIGILIFGRLSVAHQTDPTANSQMPMALFNW